MVQMALNMRQSKLFGKMREGRTSECPFFVMFGREPSRPGRIPLVGLPKKKFDVSKFLDSLQSLESEYKDFQKIYDELFEYEKGRKRSQKGKLFSYCLGDLVLCALRPTTGTKLFARWEGPYVVTKVLHSLVFEVTMVGLKSGTPKSQLPPRGRLVVHAERMILLSSHVHVHDPATLVDLSRRARLDAESFIMEKILAHGVDPDDQDKVVFKIKWEGFDHEQDHTWESEDNVRKTLGRALKDYCTTTEDTDGLLTRCLARYQKWQTRGRKKKKKRRARPE
jgi:hypothetical protein